MLTGSSAIKVNLKRLFRILVSRLWLQAGHNETCSPIRQDKQAYAIARNRRTVSRTLKSL